MIDRAMAIHVIIIVKECRGEKIHWLWLQMSLIKQIRGCLNIYIIERVKLGTKYGVDCTTMVL